MKLKVWFCSSCTRVTLTQSDFFKSDGSVPLCDHGGPMLGALTALPTPCELIGETSYEETTD